MFDFINMANNYESRKVAKWNSPDHTRMVSTARVSDGYQPYETAFKHPDYNDGAMVIVEAYDTKEEAQTGHKKWLKIMLEGPLPDFLKDARNCDWSPDEEDSVFYRKNQTK